MFSIYILPFAAHSVTPRQPDSPSIHIRALRTRWGRGCGLDCGLQEEGCEESRVHHNTTDSPSAYCEPSRPAVSSEACRPKAPS